MSIFSRFADIVNSNISALLDRAEDPEKMIKLIIQEMEDTLVEVRTNSARAIADKKELVRRVERLQHQIDDWQSKAMLALSQQREDLARAALLEKQKLQSLLADMQQELTLVSETIDKLSSEVSKLESKIAETRAKQQGLAIRSQAAANRRSVQKQLDTQRTQEAMAKFEQYARKVDELEAQADVFGQTSQSKSLADEFAELHATDAIEKELARLKKTMQGNAKPMQDDEK